MHARALVAIVCLLVAGMAGCLGTPGEEEPDPEAGEQPSDLALRAPIELTGCTQHEAFFDIPASQAAPYLPDGFEPVGAGGQPLPEGAAVLFVESLACPGSAGGEASNHLWIAIMVDAPEAYEHEEGFFHFIVVTGVTTNETLATGWAAWGIPGISPGDIELDVRGAPPLVVDAQTLADHEGNELRFATSVPGPHRAGDAGEGRLFGVENGQLTAIVDVTFGSYEGTFGGAATLESDGPLPFDVRGPGAGGHFEGLDRTYRYVELPERLELVGCDEQFGMFTVPASQAEAYLPEGFTLVGVGGDPLPEGTAALVVLSLECQNAYGDETVTQVWVHLPVEPPEAYEREDAVLHYIPVTWPTSNQAFLEALHAWGIPQVTLAEILLDAGSADPGLASWETQINAGEASATFSTETVGTHPTAGGGVVRMFGVGEGEVVGMVDFQGTEYERAAGVATLEDDGIIPLDVEGSGSGGLALGYDAVLTPVELPGGR